MQRWRHGRPIEILEVHRPDSEGLEEVFLIHAEHLYCQVIWKLCQLQTDPAVDVFPDSASMIKIDAFRSVFSCAETLTSLALAQLYNPTALPPALFVLDRMPPLLFDGERIDLQAYDNGFLGWLRRLISGKDQKKRTRPDEKKPEQSRPPARREGGRVPREPRDLDVWE